MRYKLGVKIIRSKKVKKVQEKKSRKIICSARAHVWVDPFDEPMIVYLTSTLDAAMLVSRSTFHQVKRHFMPGEKLIFQIALSVASPQQTHFFTT